MTTIELLVAILILSIITISALQFFESFQYKASEHGEYETAKFLAFNGIENQRQLILDGDYKTGITYQNDTFVNRVRFKTTIVKTNKTSDFAFFDDTVPMYELMATVEWKGRKMEVSTYVSAR